jgi:hypothetical protein
MKLGSVKEGNGESQNPREGAKQGKRGVLLTADEGKRNRNVTAENTDKTTFFLRIIKYC